MHDPAPSLPRFAQRRTTGPAPLVLGCMNFGRRTPEPEAERIVARALEAGIQLFDTANAYGDGTSEAMLGRILKRLGAHHAAIATKVGWWRQEGLQPERVVQALDESLERLGCDRVAVYYLHVPDATVPIERTLEGVARVLASGRAKAFGVSNFASWQILETFHACQRMGLPSPLLSQQLYNLLIRQLDLEYLRFATKYELHTTVYNPLAGGLLTDRAVGPNPQSGARFHKNALYQRRYLSEPFRDAAAAFASLAGECGLSLVALAYAWLMQRPGVDSILVGPGSLVHLDDAIAAGAVVLEPEVLQRIDAIHRALVGTDASYAR